MQRAWHSSRHTEGTPSPARVATLVLKGPAGPPFTQQGTHRLRPGGFCPPQASAEHSTHLLTLGYASVLRDKETRRLQNQALVEKSTHLEEIPSFSEEGADTSLRLKGSQGLRIPTQSLLNLF